MTSPHYRTITFALGLCVSSIAAPLRAQQPSQEIRESARAMAPPACGAAGTLCISDTTTAVSHECCIASAVATLLVLANAGDSLEFYAVVPPGEDVTPLVTLGLRGLRQFWQEHLPGVTAPFLRHLFARAGTYTLQVDLDMPDPDIGVSYELRISQSRVSRRLAVASVSLELPGRNNARYLVRPHSSTSIGGERGGAFEVEAGTFRLLGVPGDSIDVCRLPCRHPETVVLSGSVRTVHL